jgi:plasmid replication initiation protein
MKIIEVIKNPVSRQKKKKRKEIFDPKCNQFIYQHNKLVEAKYSLTVQEKRLILIALSKIKPTDDRFDLFSISIKEIAESYGIKDDPGSLYTEIDKVATRLRSRVLKVKNLERPKDTLTTGWVDYVDYKSKEGIVVLKFSEFLTSYLLQLKSQFTPVSLSQTLNLSSIYAIRMFELLKQYETIGERTFDLENLRETLGISKNKLPNYKNFKQKVLSIAQRELSLKTDIYFDFEEIKTSRKVTSLKFLIRKNTPNTLTKEQKKANKIKEEVKNTEERQELLELGFSNPTIRKFIESYSHERIKTAIHVVLDQIEKGQAKNPKALFQKALKEEWSLDKFVVRDYKK